MNENLNLVEILKKNPIGVKGHTLFCFNEVTKKLKVAPMKQECMLGFDGSVIYKNNVVVEKDCVYVQALNEKNARKKLIKMGYIL